MFVEDMFLFCLAMTDLNEMTVSWCLQISGVDGEHGAAGDQVSAGVQAPHHDGVGHVA